MKNLKQMFLLLFLSVMWGGGKRSECCNGQHSTRNGHVH